MLWSSSLYCCGFCKPGAASPWGQLCVTCLSRRSGFAHLRRFFRLHLQLRNGSEDRHCRAPRGRPAGHFLLTRAASGSRSFWHFPFLYCWQLNFLSIYCRKVNERSPLLCSEGIYFQKAPGFHVRRLLGRGGTRLLLILLHSARLHGGKILLPILGSAWSGPQLHHSNMLKSKMHMPLK